MSTLTVSPELQAQIAKLQSLTELRSEKGEVLGFFAPKSLPDADKYARAAAHFEPEEIRKVKTQQGPGVTTTEVLAKLHAQGK